MSITPLLVPAVQCTKCGTRPNYRITPAQRVRHLRDQDDTLVGTWRCQRCGETNLVLAVAYKEATPDGKAA